MSVVLLRKTCFQFANTLFRLHPSGQLGAETGLGGWNALYQPTRAGQCYNTVAMTDTGEDKSLPSRRGKPRFLWHLANGRNPVGNAASTQNVGI